MKEIDDTNKWNVCDDTNKWKDTPGSRIGRINIVKLSMLPKEICRSNAYLSKNNNIFHRTGTNSPKIYIEVQKISNRQTDFEKEHSWSITISDFRIYYTKTQ